MPIYNKVLDNPTAAPAERIRLDERFVSLLITEDAQARLEAPRVAPSSSTALCKPSPTTRCALFSSAISTKNRPAKSRRALGISRDAMAALEQSGLEKLRQGLEDWHRRRLNCSSGSFPCWLRPYSRACPS